MWRRNLSVGFASLNPTYGIYGIEEFMERHSLTPERPGSGPRLRSSVQFLVSLGVTLAFLAYLLVVPAASRKVKLDDDEAMVELTDTGLIRIKPKSPLEKKIAVVAVKKEKLDDPLLTVSGRVVASLRPGKTKDDDFWQFDSPEVLTAYTDWKKAQADIAFTTPQLKQVKKLAEIRLAAQRRVVARLEKLTGPGIGTESVKDLENEKANLLQTENLGMKDVHEAETALRVAKRNEATMARQLQQAGLDPELLNSATSDDDIVMADVPEGKLGLVKKGSKCRATFFGLPDLAFDGAVDSIAPVLSKERRSLRVLFKIKDLHDQLRSGMFADIGIGVERRDVLLVPAEGVLHIARADYALAEVEGGAWRIAEVQIGEPHRGDVQILAGLKEGERVVGKGAILLKPLVVRSLDALALKGDHPK